MTNQTNTKINRRDLDEILVFEKKLEYIFDCETKVIANLSNENQFNLVIEIHSNFSLSELIALLRLPNFSNQWKTLNALILKFKNEVAELKNFMSDFYEIEEISIFLKNTSITISSTDQNSILAEIFLIVYSIIQHFDIYSSHMGMIPNAIHIPIYEDHSGKEVFDKNNFVIPPFSESPYSKFWGLYFDDLEKPLIYDLKRSCIIPGLLDLGFD